MLDHAGHNCNLTTEAESLVMTKEYLIERYGTLRYTIGTGCSGGSLAQQWISNAYPGIYQGILPTCSFPDAWSTASQFLDYHLTLHYLDTPSNWGAGGDVDRPADGRRPGPRAIANSGSATRRSSMSSSRPTRARGPRTQDRYNPTTNPGGVRCTIQDAAINVFGPRLPALWGPQEKQVGHGFAGVPTDNVGVQYGLGALRSGKINAAQFVDLNVKIGGLDADASPAPNRMTADRPALANAYRSGMINETNNLDRTAIIDCRGPDEGLFHDAYRAFALRARLDREHGGHANQLIWEGPTTIIADPQCELNSMLAMDRWLTAVENDHSRKPLERKIARDKPADLTDRCYDGKGVKVSDALCPSVVHVYGTPRMVAGDSITTDTNKCRLKPLDRRRLRRRELHRRTVVRTPQDLPGRRVRLLQARRRPAADDRLADLPGRPRQGDLRRPADWSAAEEHSDQGEPPRRLGALGVPADLEEVPDATHGGPAQDELQEDAGGAYGEREDHYREVLQQDAQRQQHDSQGRQRVQSRERRCEERSQGTGDHKQPEDGVARAMVEEKAATASHQPPTERITFISPLMKRVRPPPVPRSSLRQRAGSQILVPSGDQLKRHEHRDDLEQVRRAASRQRQRRNAEEEDENEREAPLLEHVDQATEGLVAVACQPALDLIAGVRRRQGPVGHHERTR